MFERAIFIPEKRPIVEGSGELRVVSEFSPAGDQPGLARIRDALIEDRPCREILRNYKKDGTLFYNELSITPMHDDQENITYYLGVQKDVTERVEAIAELERVKGKAKD